MASAVSYLTIAEPFLTRVLGKKKTPRRCSIMPSAGVSTLCPPPLGACPVAVDVACDTAQPWPEDLRIALKIDSNVKVLSCVATEKEEVKNVLLELLYSIIEEMDAQA